MLTSLFARIGLVVAAALVLAAAGASAGPASQSGGGKKGAKFFVKTPKPGTVTITVVTLRALKPNAPPPRIVPVNLKELPRTKAQRKAALLATAVVKIQKPKPKTKSRDGGAGDGSRAPAANRARGSSKETTLYGSVTLYANLDEPDDPWDVPPRTEFRTTTDQYKVQKVTRKTVDSEWAIGIQHNLNKRTRIWCEYPKQTRRPRDWVSPGRWGVRGSGDFGNGLSAIYSMELSCGDKDALKIFAQILSGKGVPGAQPPPSAAAPSGTWKMGPLSETVDPLGQPVWSRAVWGEVTRTARKVIDGARFDSTSGIPTGGILVDDSGSPVGGPGSTVAAGPDFFISGGFGPNAKLNFCLFWTRDGPRPNNQPMKLQTIKTDQTRDNYTTAYLPDGKYPCDF